MALRRYFSVRNLMRNDSRMGWEKRREVRLVSMKETEEKNNGYVVINMKNPRISWEAVRDRRGT
jgi:hypothetical protein